MSSNNFCKISKSFTCMLIEITLTNYDRRYCSQPPFGYARKSIYVHVTLITMRRVKALTKNLTRREASLISHRLLFRLCTTSAPLPWTVKAVSQRDQLSNVSEVDPSCSHSHSNSVLCSPVTLTPSTAFRTLFPQCRHHQFFYEEDTSLTISIPPNLTTLRSYPSIHFISRLHYRVEEKSHKFALLAKQQRRLNCTVS